MNWQSQCRLIIAYCSKWIARFKRANNTHVNTTQTFANLYKKGQALTVSCIIIVLIYY
jgi:hypothetical protein